MTFRTFLVLLLIILICAAFPAWLYGSEWGYAPGGVITICLAIVLIILAAR